MGYGDEYGGVSERDIPSQTRTRLPETSRGTARRPSSPGRTLATIAGVVVLLIAAIVLANQAREDAPDDGTSANDTSVGGEPEAGEAAVPPTAPSGQSPVTTATDAIPTGHPQTEQGAQSAAANYAVALGGEAMFRTAERHRILDTVIAPSAQERFRAALDASYSAETLGQLGLDAAGNPPEGLTLISRTTPIGTALTSYDGGAATVEVWCSELFGLAGEASTSPVTSGWFTVTLELAWVDGDWKATHQTQVPGPAPVPGDLRASTAEDITEAVEKFGGFTYAR